MRANVVELPELRGRTRVFPGRPEAGRVLANMMGDRQGSSATVLAIPAGGAPVGAALADALALPLDVAVVSKIMLPWNTEAGYGAVAFDGSVLLNETLLARLPLTDEDVAAGVTATRAKVERRISELRGSRPPLDLAQTAAILVDDGLASGFTMRAAVRAVRGAGAPEVIIAVPTAGDAAVEALSPLVDRLYCPNIRPGLPFAVADAYQRWYDVADEELREILGR